MTDAQRAALADHDLTLISTLMGGRRGEYILLARKPDEAGTLVLIDHGGNVHPYVDSRANTVRVNAADLPA